MKYRTCASSLALTALALLGLTIPRVAQAQGLPKDQVPFKATLKAAFRVFVIPVNPPISSVEETGTGEATPLGQFTWVGHLMAHLGVDGIPTRGTNGIGVLTAANGDALFVTFDDLSRPSSKPGVALFEGAFTITGGKGRFTGAVGSGFARFEVTPGKGEVAVSWEGTVSAPKA